MTVLAGIGLIFIAVLVVLAIPVTLVFRLSWPQKDRRDVAVRWFFWRIRLDAGAGAEPKRDKSRDERARKRDGSSPTQAGDVLAALRYAPFRRRLMRFVGDVWSSIQKRDVFIHLRLGLGDPADTGQLWALLGPLAGMLATVDDASIRIDPDFVDAAVEVDAGGELRVVPLRLIGQAVMLMLSPDFRHGLRRMRGAPQTSTVGSAAARR